MLDSEVAIEEEMGESSPAEGSLIACTYLGVKVMFNNSTRLYTHIENFRWKEGSETGFSSGRFDLSNCKISTK